MLSFITKKERISNIWMVNYVEDNSPGSAGFPYDLDRFTDARIIIALDKSGRARIDTDSRDGEPATYSGRWEFRDNARSISWTWDEAVIGFEPVFNESSVYRIRMLREDQVHLTSADGRFRLHLNPR